jgi:cyclopropane-fatty-acyl-phospholipid synthase
METKRREGSSADSERVRRGASAPPVGPTEPTATQPGLATECRDFVQSALVDFPHRIRVTDWHGVRWEAGRGEPHWSGRALDIRFHSEEPARHLLRLDGMRFVEAFLEGRVDLEGNLYVLASLRRDARLGLKLRALVARVLRVLAFQNVRRARVSVKSHYDIPQEALNVYLDRVYMSYSCGMFEDPDDLNVRELRRPGIGEADNFDSLEKAQWRKLKDAVDYVRPAADESVLDVGCGYGGQLLVALESHPVGKIVGWTHSANQAREGRRLLERFPQERWELNEGDYRVDARVYDHVTSTGMISHVGPRGLVPYVREVRRRIRTGGRYLHHALMTRYSRLPIDMNVGIAFNKRYVWPGFHWFTVGEHVRALEKNGFQVEQVVSLTRHYAKTTAAWYERMMEQRETMRDFLDEATLRAWQIFLAGITGSFLNRDVHVYRLYCVAT